jgi:hypothetical protein
MKEQVISVILIFLLLSPLSAPANLKDSMEPSKSIEKGVSNDILFLGNSYTNQNNLASKLNELMDSGGEEVSVSALTGGGLNLKDHEEKARDTEDSWNLALNEANDYVILQDQSQIPSFPTSSTSWRESKAGAIYLNERIWNSNGNTILFMTWGYKDGDSNNQWRNPDYLTMQLHLRQGYEMYLENITTDSQPAFIAPVGLAFEYIYNNVADTGVDPSVDSTSFSNLYSSDGSHPSIDGTYLAACVFHSILTGNSTIGLDYPNQISPSRALELQQAASATVFNNTPNYLYPFHIEPPSINYGPDSGSVFSIDPGIQMNLNVNFTNYADQTDTAEIIITGAEGWNIWWGYNNDTTLGHEFNAPSGATGWVQFSITAPATKNGLPLANSIHEFSMELITGSDGRQDWYNFSMKYGYHHEAEIVEGGGIFSISPFDVATISMIARNLGNTQRDLEIGIRPVDENGTPLEDFGQAFALDDWNIFVLDRHELNELYPNQTANIRFQVESPFLTSGSMFFEVKIWNLAAPEDAVYTIQRVNIVPRSGGTLELNNIDCNFDISPGESCRTELIIENTGDIPYEFELKLLSTPEWLDVDLNTKHIELNPSEVANGINLNASVRPGTSSNLQATIIVELWVDNWNPSTVELMITSGDYFEWELEILSTETTDENNLTSTWKLTNLGNIEDGLVVNLDVNVFTQFGLIPPEGATFSSSGNPRSFEILNIQIGESVTFTAWMIVPDEAPVDTSATLTIEAHSMRDPRISFTATDSATIGGVGSGDGHSDVEESKILKWLQSWHTVILSILVIIVGSIGVAMAIKYRLKEDRKRLGLPSEDDGNIENWMETYSKKERIMKVSIESPQQDASEFATKFIEKSGGLTEKIRSAPAPQIVDEAGHTLDRAMTEDALDDIVEIADDLNEGELIHPDNVMLDLEDDFESRISRLSKKNDAEK